MIPTYLYLTGRPRPEPPPRRKPGPTAGLTEDPAEFLARHADVIAALKAGKSLRTVQKDTGKARNTVIKVRRMMTRDGLP